MITLTKLEIHNFCILESVDLELGPRVFLIRGENRDEASATSNGSGKSLLCQSIVWCLFNDIIRKDMRVDDVIGPNDDWVSVCVELTKHNQHIRVERYRNHPEHGTKSVLYIDGNLEEVHTKTDEKIVQVLGISSKTLYHFSYSDPDRTPLVALTPAGIKAVVSEMLDIQRFDSYIKEIRDRGSIQKNELKSVEMLFEDQGMQMRKLHEKKSELEVQSMTFAEEQQSKIEALEQQLLVIQVDISELPDFEEEQEEIEERLEELDEVIENFQAMNKKMKDVQTDIAKASKSHLKAQSALIKTRAAIADVRKSKANLDNNPAGTCTYCGGLLADSKHVAKILESLTEEMNQAEVTESEYATKVNELASILQRLEVKKEKLEVKLAKQEDSFKEYTELQARQTQIEKGIAGQEKLFRREESLLEKIEAAKEVKPPSSSNIDLIEDQLEELAKKRDGVHKKIQTIEQTIVDLKDLEKAVSQMKIGIFNNFIGSLYSRIQEFLDQMTGGDFEVKMQEKKGELSFLFSSPSKGGKFWSYNVFSTGERARIRKAVQVALESLVDAGFWIDDEGLDGVDPGGLPLILDFIFKDRVKDKTVFIVSHQTALNDYFDDHPVINVIKEGGVSRVEFIDN